MRLYAFLDFYTYEDANATNDPQNTTKMLQKMDIAGINNVNRSIISVADETEDQEIALPDTTADFLVIATDRAISIKLNGSATEQVLTPAIAGKKTVVLFQKGAVSSLTISNDSGNAANVDIIMAK
jgi:hypothetical protein